MSFIQNAAELIDHFARAADAKAAAAHFNERMKPFGALGIATRLYRRPEGPLQSDALWKAGGHVAIHWPPGWEQSPGFRYICIDENPLLEAVKTRQPWFRYSDLAPHNAHGTYWEAFSEGRISDGIGILSFGDGRKVGSLAMVFERMEFSPTEEALLRAAGSVLLERTAALMAPVHDDRPTLTPRERDCMAYVAAGKSDWEISVILGLSQATVRFHVDNARTKVGASNRAHAVARLAAYGMI